MRDGCASISPRASSCHTRSATSASASPLRDHGAHQLQRLGRDREIEARGEARHAQDAHRVFGERRPDVAQHARLQIGGAAERIDEIAGLVPRDRVDREIAAREILLRA